MLGVDPNVHFDARKNLVKNDFIIRSLIYHDHDLSWIMILVPTGAYRTQIHDPLYFYRLYSKIINNI